MHREEMKINQKVESDNMPNELKAREQADIAGPRGLIGSYLAVIKAPAAAISNRENEQHCSAGKKCGRYHSTRTDIITKF